jgi:predicted RNA binding protein YcfA (HicA-like mRNA interferase family)
LPKLPRLTAEKAEKLLLQSGFQLIRSKGGHRIYLKNNKRIILPFHSGKILHPKIVKQVYRLIEK